MFFLFLYFYFCFSEENFYNPHWRWFIYQNKAYTFVFIKLTNKCILERILFNIRKKKQLANMSPIFLKDLVPLITDGWKNRNSGSEPMMLLLWRDPRKSQKRPPSMILREVLWTTRNSDWTSHKRDGMESCSKCIEFRYDCFRRECWRNVLTTFFWLAF